MKTEETIQDIIRRAKLQLGDDYGDKQMMEEAIFRAGIWECLDWVSKKYGLLRSNGDMKDLRDQLKKWGIK